MHITKTITKLQKKNELEGVKVSLYVPSHPNTNSSTFEQDRIRLKNALQEVQHQLGGSQVLDKEMNKLEAKILSDSFITNLSLAVGIFVSEGHTSIVRLPIETEPATRVSDSFLLEPLHLVQNLMIESYIIDVNMNKPRLFFGGMNDLQEVDVNLKSFDELLELDHEQNHQFHGGAGNNGNAQFHGHGAGKDQKESDFQFYTEYIAGVLEKKLSNTKQLVLLAGEEQSTHALKAELRVPNVAIVDSGNIEHFNKTQIQQILSDELQKRTKSTLEGLRGKSQIISGLKKSVQVIKEGRAASVFVPALRSTTDSVRSGIEKRFVLTIPSSQKTLDAIRGAIEHGGNVFAVRQSDLREIAVSLRY